MSSTNKTTHYNLSQYIGTDKPTYLVDYNADMSAIDTGIYAAKNEADTNTTNIGNLSNLTTTEKTNLVGAINEIDGDVGTLDTTVGNHTTAIADNTSNIGNLANLTTTSKTNLVSAINEVDGNVDSLASKFNLTSITKYTTGTLSNGTLIDCDITVATNSDKSVCKIYGTISTNDGNNAKLSLPTSFNVSEEFNVNLTGINFNRNSLTLTGYTTITFKTNGTIELSVGNGVNYSMYQPMVIFVNNFGDQPGQ